MKRNGSEIPIQIADLQKSFGEQEVLKGISLQVKSGETVAVLGRSGGGKSVLLKLIIGLQTPDGGSIQVAGKEITKLDEPQLNEVRKRVGFLFRRVGLARALALDPEILLFDEPTAGLDPITAAEIGDLIVSLKRKRKMGAVVVTHDVHGANAYSDRMVLLHEGSIAAEGSFDDLQSSQDEFVKQFFSYSSR